MTKIQISEEVLENLVNEIHNLGGTVKIMSIVIPCFMLVIAVSFLTVYCTSDILQKKTMQVVNGMINTVRQIRINRENNTKNKSE